MRTRFRINQWMNAWMNQSINQSTDPPINQSINQSTFCMNEECKGLLAAKFVSADQYLGKNTLKAKNKSISNVILNPWKKFIKKSPITHHSLTFVMMAATKPGRLKLNSWAEHRANPPIMGTNERMTCRVAGSEVISHEMITVKSGAEHFTVSANDTAT